MLTSPFPENEVVLSPDETKTTVLCETNERNLFGRSKKTFHFSFSPSASMEEVRELLAAELSLEPACVHLQVLVRASNEYETVTRGSVADALALSNSESNTLTVVYSTENRFGCDPFSCTVLLAACCCCFGYTAAREDERARRGGPPPPRY